MIYMVEMNPLDTGRRAELDAGYVGPEGVGRWRKMPGEATIVSGSCSLICL